AETTAGAGTYKLSVTSSMDGFGGAGGFAMTMEGAVDTEAGRSRLTTAASSGGPDMDVDAVIDGTAAHLRSDLTTEAGRSAKPSLKAEVGSLGGIGPGTLGPSTQDPTVVLDLLEEVAGPVETVGEEEVRGVATTHV